MRALGNDVGQVREAFIFGGPPSDDPLGSRSLRFARGKGRRRPQPAQTTGLGL